jgi:hypothetical protein
MVFSMYDEDGDVKEIYHEDGTTTDRDLNAAINLENYYTESSSEIYASGDGSSKVKTFQPVVERRI